ncbi:MAG: hypothetical protein ACUVQM_05420 [Candidatus Hadarchaeaceae archaeon]
MVEGSTAKAYALRMSMKFKDETVREVSARTRRLFVSAKELIGRRFLELKVEQKGMREPLHVYNKYKSVCKNCGGPTRLRMCFVPL